MTVSSHSIYTSILCLLMAGQSVTVWAQPRERIAAVPVCENYVNIIGESNVNQFSFRYSKNNIPDKSGNSSGDTGNISISIPIRDFKASNPMMYGDFLDLMKESEYPRILVSFSKSDLLSSALDLSGNYPHIHITIAGITRVYKIKCTIYKCAENLYLSGEETIKLSDFQLKSPQKMLGMVKVNDEITVNFGFIVTFTPANQITAKF